ncbi:MAG: hypothetical protein HUJ26_10790 [Planctomycetaceae bacterium]|nr:hypothetical protein [Planctomycetaceae bacterium]
MTKLLIALGLSSFCFILTGCGGGEEISEEAQQQADELANDPDYEQQMMGGADPSTDE